MWGRVGRRSNLWISIETGRFLRKQVFCPPVPARVCTQEVFQYTVSVPVSLAPPLPRSSCWWRWCRSPALWSSAGSRGASSCRRASPGCGPRRPACPPSGPGPTGRREEGSGRPASQPRPAPAGRAAPRTPLHTEKPNIWWAMELRSTIWIMCAFIYLFYFFQQPPRDWHILLRFMSHK